MEIKSISGPREEMEDADNQLSILRMMYDDVVKAGKLGYVCEDSENKYIVDEHGSVKKTFKDKHSVTVDGDILVMDSRYNIKQLKAYAGEKGNRYINGSKLHVLDCYTVTNVDTLDNIIVDSRNFDVTVSNNIVVISSKHSSFINKFIDVLDSGFNTIISLDNCELQTRSIRKELMLRSTAVKNALKEMNNLLYITYECCENYLRNHTIIIDLKTQKLLECDRQNFSGITVISNSKSKKGEYGSINTNTLDTLDYRLMLSDGKLSDECYSDITKPSELKNTNIVYTHRFTGGKHLIGAIDSYGKTLISPIYSSVKYIGYDCFIVTLPNKTETTLILNSKTKRPLFNDRIAYAKIHETLPVVLVTLVNRNEYVFDLSSGQIYNIADIARHFELYASQSQRSLLMYNTAYGKKYLVNDMLLTPVSNMHSISKLRLVTDWYRI